MPNWCEGKLKIRGTRENIIKWLDDGIVSVDLFGEVLYKYLKVGELHEDNSQIVLINTLDNHYSFYVKGIHRGFITTPIRVDFWKADEEGNEYACVDYKEAWDIYPHKLAAISKQYDLDFKIYGFESGMEFNRDIEIVNGEVVLDDKIEFNDYFWECINPKLGG